MKAYKSIYRLDYPHSFKLVDSFGRYAEMLHESARVAPFKLLKTDVNTVEHKVSSHVLIGDDKAVINVERGSIDCLVEYRAGVPLGEAYKHPVVKLVQQLIAAMESDIIRRVERLGVRHWLIQAEEKFTFDALREVFAGKQDFPGKAVAQLGADLIDCAVIFEARKPDGTFLRTIMGPYKKVNEQARYFSFDHAVEEGLVIDLDMWQQKLEIPGISIETFGKNFEKDAKRMLDKTASELLSLL